jgi:hypothetical protein
MIHIKGSSCTLRRGNQRTVYENAFKLRGVTPTSEHIEDAFQVLDHITLHQIVE